MRTPFSIGPAVLLLVAVAYGDNNGDEKTGAQTFTVQIGGQAERFRAFNAYLGSP